MTDPPTSNPVLFASKGGARVGHNYWIAMSYNFPFAELVLSRNFIELTFVPATTYRFPADAIDRIELVQGFTLSGIRIVHFDARLPRYITFWPLPPRRDKLLRALAAGGYKIK